MRDIDSIRRELEKAHQGLPSWPKVSAKYGITPAMAWRIVNEDGYEPKRADIRVKLDLPALAEVPVCRKCGHAHVTKRCTAHRNSRPKRQPPIRIADCTPEERAEVLALTPEQRRRRLLQIMPEWF